MVRSLADRTFQLRHRAALKTEALKAELAGPSSGASAAGDGSGGAPDGWIEWNASWEQPSTPAVASVFPAGFRRRMNYSFLKMNDL